MGNQSEHLWDGTGDEPSEAIGRRIRFQGKIEVVNNRNASVLQDMELLIQQKINRYSQVITQIVPCELTVVDGKCHIFVASVRPNGMTL